MAETEYINLREPGAWRRLTRWQRYMVSLNDRFKGNTRRILTHLGKERGFKPELDVDWGKYIRNPESTWKERRIMKMSTQEKVSEPHSGGTRSEPGKGDKVWIVNMKPCKPGEPTGGGYSSSIIMDPGWGQTAISIGINGNEDFAVCHWPITLKVKEKANISNEQLIQSLRDLADALEAGVNLCIRPLVKVDWKPTDGWPEPPE